MKEICRVEQVIALLRQISIDEFDKYILNYLERKSNKQLALAELDNIITSVNNCSLNLSLYLKQNYLLVKESSTKNAIEDSDCLTKRQVAKKYGVDVRTVTNWIRSGLQAIEIGGVIRIGKDALEKFIRENKSKKFNWKSIVKI
jgi:hypothetical protein